MMSFFLDLLLMRSLHGLTRWIALAALWGPPVVIAFVMACNLWITRSTRQAIHNEPNDVEFSEVALVLGTSKFLVSGRENLHFAHRMEVAADLYRLGKVRHLLVSGDNSVDHYNEPLDMKNRLLELGVPEEAITCDYAGLRTLDSMVRAQKIFQLDRVLVVSDQFHLPRAVFTGRHYGMDVTGLACREVTYKTYSRAEKREYLARVMAVLDLYVFRKKPKFLGEPVPLSLRDDSK